MEDKGIYVPIYSCRDIIRPMNIFKTRKEALEGHKLMEELARPRKMSPLLGILRMAEDYYGI